MKKRILGSILALLLMLTLLMSAPLSLSAAEPEPFGTTRTSVTQGMTYTISTQEELARFSYLSRIPSRLHYYGVTILLTSDITITNDYDSTSDGNWTPVYWFFGTFDGGGHTVTIQCAMNYTEIGFIGMNSGIVKNLTVAGSVSRDYGYSLGGIAGVNYSTIINCRNSAAVGSNDATAVGGITGINYGSIINSCNSGVISGTWLGGGIAGYGNQATFLNCYNAGTVTGTGFLGSVVGHISDTDTVVVKNCYWLSSSYAVGIGSVHADAPPENLIDFDTSGMLSTEVSGTIDLLQALNNWAFANQTSTGCSGWKAGSPYPILTQEPVIMTEELENAIQSEPYSAVLKVISGTPVTWTLTGGLLPPGLTLSSDGIISGTPTTGGMFDFQVQAQNDFGTVSRMVALRVLYLQTPLSITSVPTSVTCGDTFTVDISGGSGKGDLTLGISNQTDLSGNSTSGVASIDSSGLVTVLKPGKFQITAEKAGDGRYTVCSTISSVITVNKIPSSISLTGVPDSRTYGDAPFTIGTSTGSGTGTLTLGISNQTDLFGHPATGVAAISSSGEVTLLKAGKFQITAEKAEDDFYTACSTISGVVTVHQKIVTVSGIGAADKDYDGTDKAVITGLNTAVLNGIINGDDVALDITNAAGLLPDSTTGAGKTVTFAGFALKGAHAGNYTLTQPAPVTAAIRQANPPYTLPGIFTATQGQTLINITLPKDAYGVYTFDDPLTTSVGNPGEHNFTVTFTPFDTVNYKTITGIVLVIKVKAVSPSTAAASSASASSVASTVSAPASNTTASDITAPQMGSSPASYLPFALVVLFSSAGLIVLKLRKSRSTK